MIEINDFAREIETALNANAYGIAFKVFTDEAEFQTAIKTPLSRKKFTNAIMRVGPSSITPTQGLTVATQSVAIEFCAALPNPDTDEEIVTAHRATLDGFFKKYTVSQMSGKDNDGNTVTYTVSALYSLAGTGDVAVRDGVGTSVTFNVSAEFAYIENGLNSNNCTFTLDGFTIPYTAAKITKSPTAQSDAFSDSNGKGESVNTSFVRSFDFQLPALNDKNGIGSLIIDGLLGDELFGTHTLVISIVGRIPKTYTVTFASTDITLEGINNAGHNISLIERAFGGNP